MIQERVPLGELIRIKHGFAFKGVHFTDSGKYIVLTPGNFRNEGGLKLKGEKEKYYAIQPPEDYILNEGDLLVVMTDLVGTAPMLGGSLIVPESDKFLHNQRLGLVTIIDEERIGKGYLYHLLNMPNYRGQIRGSASGATVRHTAPERIYKAIVNLPERQFQDRVSKIVDSYNDLIANNRRRIKLLEEAARLIYRDWFISLRFPGHELSKIENGRPEGWHQAPIADLTEFLSRGISPSYDDDAPGLVINQKCVRDGLLDLGPARHQCKKVPAPKLVQVGDVLVNSTGAGTLGRVAQVLEEIPDCTVDSHVTIVRPREDLSPAWFGMALVSMQSVIEGMGKGATNQTELSKTDLGELKLTVPSKAVSDEFDQLVSPLRRQVQVLRNQCKALQRARDLLLPRLMSGEIEV